MSTRITDFPDGYTNATAPSFGAGIGSGAIEPFQELVGTGDGVTTTFDLTHTPYSDESVLVCLNGLPQNKTDWSLVADDVIFSVAPSVGQFVYVYYFRLAPGGGGGGGGTSVKTEYRTITAPEAAAKSLTLVAAPSAATEVMLGIRGGSLGFYGVDFTVSGSTLTWNALALDGVLSSGDQVVLNYSY